MIKEEEEEEEEILDDGFRLVVTTHPDEGEDGGIGGKGEMALGGSEGEGKGDRVAGGNRGHGRGAVFRIRAHPQPEHVICSHIFLCSKIEGDGGGEKGEGRRY